MKWQKKIKIKNWWIERRESICRMNFISIVYKKILNKNLKIIFALCLKIAVFADLEIQLF